MNTSTNDYDVPDPGWDAYSSTQAVGVFSSLEVVDEYDCKGRSELFKKLTGLRTPEEGETLPTDRTLNRAYEVFSDLTLALNCHQAGMDDPTWSFPKGFVATDENGGIRIEWWHANKHCIALSISPVTGRPDTVFSSLEDDPGTLQASVQPTLLATQLRLLNKIAQRG